MDLTLDVSKCLIIWTKPLARGVRWCFSTYKFRSLANFCDNSNFSGLSLVPSANNKSQTEEGYEANLDIPWVSVSLSLSQFLSKNMKSLSAHAQPMVGTYFNIFLAKTLPLPIERDMVRRDNIRLCLLNYCCQIIIINAIITYVNFESS